MAHELGVGLALSKLGKNRERSCGRKADNKYVYTSKIIHGCKYSYIRWMVIVQIIGSLERHAI